MEAAGIGHESDVKRVRCDRVDFELPVLCQVKNQLCSRGRSGVNNGEIISSGAAEDVVIDERMVFAAFNNAHGFRSATFDAAINNNGQFGAIGA